MSRLTYNDVPNKLFTSGFLGFVGGALIGESVSQVDKVYPVPQLTWAVSGLIIGALVYRRESSKGPDQDQ